MNQSTYASIFEALCKIPSLRSSTLSELAELARRLDGGGCFVDHEGEIIDANGDVFWPDDDKGDDMEVGGEEPFVM